VDIGANIGWFAMYLQSRAKGVKVHCFEPAAAALERLRANIDANGLASYISVYPYAVSDRNGRSLLAEHQFSIERSLVRDGKNDADAEMVEMITLEKAFALCGAPHVDLLKIDVEGSEVEIVLGSDPRIWKTIERVAIEYHDYLRPGCCQPLVEALRQRDFKSVGIEKSYVIDGLGIIRGSRSP
jgi:FkbM family methyltransferase